MSIGYNMTSFALCVQGTMTQGTICPTPPMSPFHAASPLGVTAGGGPPNVGVPPAAKFSSPQNVYITENGKLPIKKYIVNVVNRISHCCFFPIIFVFIYDSYFFIQQQRLKYCPLYNDLSNYS